MPPPQDLPSRQRSSVVERRHQKNSENLDGGKILVVKVIFFNDENQFAASISRHIHFRHKLQYRTDDGTVARGLIHDSDPDKSFQNLHKILLHDKDVVQGSLAEFYARIWRVKSAIPSERRAIKVTFYPVEYVSFDPEDTYTEPPDETSSKAMTAAKRAAQKMHGQKGRRIKAYVEFAGKLTFQKRENLWIYHPHALYVFTWLPTAEKKVIIEEIEAGRLPTGPVPKTGNTWRKYVFRDLRESYQRARGAKLPEKAMETVVLGTLEGLDSDIKKGIQNLRGIGDASGAGGEGAQSRENMKFRHHIADLMRSQSKDNLYYLWNKHTADDRGIFER